MVPGSVYRLVLSTSIECRRPVFTPQMDFSLLGTRTLHHDPPLSTHPCPLGQPCPLPRIVCLLSFKLSAAASSEYSSQTNCILFSHLPLASPTLSRYVLIRTCRQPWVVALNLRARTTTSVCFRNLTAPRSEPCTQ